MNENRDQSNIPKLISYAEDSPQIDGFASRVQTVAEIAMAAEQRTTDQIGWLYIFPRQKLASQR